MSGFRLASLVGSVTALLTLCVVATAQIMPVGSFPQGSSYTGPCDITSFDFWWSGTRSCSAAYAVPGTNPAVDLIRVYDGSTCTVPIATSGVADVTTATPCGGGTVTAWATAGGAATTPAAGVGSSSGTTLIVASCTVCSFTPTSLVFNDATCGSCQFQSGNYIVSQLTGATNGVGTYRLAFADNKASADLFAFPPILVTRAYDQTQKSKCGGSCDLIGAGGSPRIDDLLYRLSGCGASGTLSCIERRPAVLLSNPLVAGGSYTPDGTATSESVVANVVSDPSTGGKQFINFNATNGTSQGSGNSINRRSGSQNWYWYTSGQNAAAADGTWHAANGHIQTGTNASDINLDGSVTTFSATYDTTARAPMMLPYQDSNNSEDVMVGEGGPTPGAFSSGTETALYANQKAFYGTP